MQVDLLPIVVRPNPRRAPEVWEAYVVGFEDHVYCVGGSAAEAADDLFNELSTTVDVVRRIAWPQADFALLIQALRTQVDAAVAAAKEIG